MYKSYKTAQAAAARIAQQPQAAGAQAVGTPPGHRQRVSLIRNPFSEKRICLDKEVLLTHYLKHPIRFEARKKRRKRDAQRIHE